MNEDLEDQLNSEERRAFERLDREKMPPLSLEERIVARLRDIEFILPRRDLRWRNRRRILAAAAAAFLLAGLGIFAGLKWVSGSKSNSPQFMLVLHKLPEDARTQASNEAQRVKEYTAWADEVRRMGLSVTGERLNNETRILRSVGGQVVVSEQPSCSSESVIAGYFLIQARDYEQAQAIARGCPHLKYGGSIEIRQIDKL
jgi:hypothetical protein